MRSAADIVVLAADSRESSSNKHFWESWLHLIIREVVCFNVSELYEQGD